MPDLHVKPTTEELEAGMKKALEEAEELKNQSTEESPKEEATEVTEDTPDEKEVVETEQPTEEEEEVVTKEPEKKEEVKEEVDYKKKFVESSRESIILHEKQKKLDQAIEQAASLPEPTEDELKKEYTDWDNLSDFEKKLAKQTLINDRRFAFIESVRQESKDIETWNKKVDGFIDDPKALIAYPELEGKTEKFKVFATKETRRGVDFDVLVNAFLHDASKEVTKHTGKMFETGTGGSKERMKQKSDKITPEQAEMLRKTDYRKFLSFVKTGKIDYSALK